MSDVNGISNHQLAHIFKVATLEEKQYIIGKLQSNYTEEQILEEWHWEGA